MNDSAAPTWFDRINSFVRREPLTAFLFAAIVITFGHFFFGVALFADYKRSVFGWAWEAWNPETNYEHAKLVPLVIIGLLWYERKKITDAPVSSSNSGWLFLGIGLLLFWIGVRTVQARIALTSLPVLLFGIVLYVWGKAVARVLLFPIAFLLFMVPLNFITQATVRLQFLETAIASTVCNVIGIHVQTLGTVVTSADNSFRFQIDEGCSGVHSLMAIAMLSAIYGHFAFDRLWKKIVLFAGALVFAIVGNAGRLVSILAAAKFFGQDLAGGPYHAISGYLSFPFALVVMVLFGKLLNLNRTHEPALPPGTAVQQ